MRINGLTADAGRAARLLDDIKMPNQVKPAEEEKKAEPKQPIAPRAAYDEYLPEEKPEPTGRYRLGQDEEGQPKIFFNDPEKAEDKEADSPAEAPSKSKDKKAEKCIGSTDKVDKEIERLKKRRDALMQQISSETDETKIKDLQQKLNQVERELRQKDNDAYRRSHTEVFPA